MTKKFAGVERMAWNIFWGAEGSELWGGLCTCVECSWFESGGLVRMSAAAVGLLRDGQLCSYILVNSYLW